MRLRSATAALLPLALMLGCTPPEPEPSGSSTPPVNADVTAFVNVSVVPMTGEDVLGEHTVLIEEGRISAIGPTAEIGIPTGAARIDGSGRFLMPGLTEMHGHLPGPNTPAADTENVLFLYVANGVTTVRGMQGNDSQIALRQKVRAGELVGPQLVLGSPAMSGASVETPEKGAELVRQYDASGYDLLKVHEDLTLETYDAIAQAALDLRMPFAGHVSDHVGLMHALEVGQSTIDHLDNYVEALVPENEGTDEPPGLRGAHELLERIDESRISALVEKTVATNGTVVPTMVLWESGIYATRASEELRRERDEIRFMPKATVDRWSEAVDARVESADVEAMASLAALRRRILKALHDGGARIVLGTDSPQIFSVPGFSIHREMALYQEIGMTPYEVLVTGTRVAGEFLQGDFGTVAVGQRADLLLLEANPLVDVANVARRAGVMVNGEYLEEARIQERLRAIAASYAR